jgi:hypothetical protein
MRMGQEAPEFVDIPSMPGLRVAQVPLLEFESQAGVIRAASLDVPDNAAGIQARNRVAIESDVWHSLRDPDDATRKVFDSVDDMIGEGGLEPSDIDYLADSLMLLMDYASPAIDGISEKVLDDLKKAFGETDLSGLTGRRWAAVKLCISVLFPELLRARLLGSGSTDSSTLTSESEEST